MVQYEYLVKMSSIAAPHAWTTKAKKSYRRDTFTFWSNIYLPSWKFPEVFATPSVVSLLTGVPCDATLLSSSCTSYSLYLSLNVATNSRVFLVLVSFLSIRFSLEFCPSSSSEMFSSSSVSKALNKRAMKRLSTCSENWSCISFHYSEFFICVTHCQTVPLISISCGNLLVIASQFMRLIF